MKHVFKPISLLFIVFFAITLAACGGVETVLIRADRLMYGSLSNFTVTGPNLDKGITFLAPKCTGVKELPGSTESMRVYTCTPSVVGDFTVTIIGGTSVLHTASFKVPVPTVSMSTNMGTIVMELAAEAAPLSVKNFLQYVSDGFYTNLIFHRVIPNFVIQGGGYGSSMFPATTRDPIKLEVPNGLSNLRGTVAMARTAPADSATSQFFINVVDNVGLDTLGGGYAVFGKVIAGMEVVDAITALPTIASPPFENLPLDAVLINSIVQTQ